MLFISALSRRLNSAFFFGKGISFSRHCAGRVDGCQDYSGHWLRADTLCVFLD